MEQSSNINRSRATWARSEWSKNRNRKTGRCRGDKIDKSSPRVIGAFLKHDEGEINMVEVPLNFPPGKVFSVFFLELNTSLKLAEFLS